MKTRFRPHRPSIGLKPALMAAALAAALTGSLMGPATAAAASPAPVALPHVGHVFVIALENESATSTFGSPAADPYLATTLPSEGAFLPNFYATGHESNDNYISMVSGQPANIFNQVDCPLYLDFFNLFTLAGIDEGLGCIFPAGTPNVGNQLTTAGLTWKTYQQDMGNVPSREAAACGHPTVNSYDGTQSAVAGDGYATRHDPFVYFHSVIDNQSYCNAHVVAMGSTSGAMPATAVAGETGLATDLRTVATTPNYSFITPNLCNDGHDFPCTNQTGGTSALADIDSFLSTWVPLITSSPAFQQDGLLEITFDEGTTTDAAACCGETPGLGSLLPGIFGAGGGRVGAVLLSPFIAPGTTTSTAYNHFSALASIETNFGLPRLGEAQTVTSLFGPDVYTRPTGH
ncbi:MAG TPA: alkaline phosphatase family protein [Acidimicrobiales bacterium]|nr:alkaline phosphatase family protein [Acidimicrobiales bacterium]